MAEADLYAYIYAGLVGLYFSVLLYILHRRKIIRLRGGRTTTPLSQIRPHYTEEEKRNFKIGIPIGLVLGGLVYLPHLVFIFGGEQQWWFGFVQIDPVIIFVTILFVYSGSKFIVAFTDFPLLARNNGMFDGIFASVVVIQIFVFIKFPLIFFPILD